MKKVGIVGGIGPASTLDYYKDIIEGYRAANQKDEYPKIIIESVNMVEMLGYVSNKQRDELVAFLLDAINNLAAAGADFAAIASNTPHIVFDAVSKQATLPLISIVDETCRYAQRQGYKKVVILGTAFTMSNGLYTNAFQKYGIEAVVPDLGDQDTVHRIIFPNLENGVIIPEEKRKMLELATNLIKSQNADALVLGCTELPLMIKPGDLETPVINTTQIHVQSIIKRLLS